MSLPSNRHDELINLLGRLRDECITETEFQRLEHLLTEDDAARDLYVQYMTLQASLEQAGGTGTLARRLRSTLRDEEIVQDLQAIIAADERSVFTTRAPRRARSRYLTVAVASAALILVALFLGHLILRRHSEAAWSVEIAAIYGRVWASGTNGETRMTPGTVVGPGQSVTTGPNASVRLQYPDGSTVDLNASTNLALLEGAKAKRLNLVTGSAYFDVSSQPAGAPLVVNPDQYDQVKVMGTSFQVNRDKKGETQVLVANGKVLFGKGNEAVPIKAKQASVAKRQQKPSPPKAFDETNLWQGLSRGLTATYYAREDLIGRSVTQVDPRIDFDWRKSSPAPVVSGDKFSIPADKFSVRWTGRVEAVHTESYTFYVIADEGARLWVDGKLVIDGWTDARGDKVPSKPMKLIAGQKYDLKLEYHEAKDKAFIQLLWSCDSTPREIVPHSQLHPSQ